MDELTNTNERLLYARVLLEIDASKEFVCTIQMNLPVRKLRIQHVVYEYEPKFCENCKMFGHTIAVRTYKIQANKQKKVVDATCNQVSGGKQIQVTGDMSCVCQLD